MAFHIKSTTKFKVLIGFSALAISGVAALFSVTGVSSLFAGAFWAIVAMMGILEFGKIVVASYLARFWYDLSKTIKTYFITAVIVLMAITSAGIFGYLSDAYQKTKGDYTVVEKQVDVLKLKKSRFEQALSDYRLEVKQVDENILSLTSALNSNRIQYKDSTGQLITTQSTQTRKLIQNELVDARNRKNLINPKIEAFTDSVTSIDISILELESKNISGELGPLKFIADAFGTEMDQVVKYLMLMLIFVFDPLAVLLFVSLSTMIRKDAEKEKEINKPDSRKEKVIEKAEKVSTPTQTIDAYSDIWKLVSENQDDANDNMEYIEEEIRQPEIETVPQTIIPDIKKKNVKRVSKKNQKIQIKENEKPEKNLEVKEEKNVSKEVKQHEFYYGNESGSVESVPQQVTQSLPEPIPEPAPQPQVSWASANSPLRFKKQ